MLKEAERKHRANLRELRRLQVRYPKSTATLNAIDRRLARDRRLLAELARLEGLAANARTAGWGV